VRCPAFLLAGETDDITTREQVFGAQQYLGTPAAQVTSRLCRAATSGCSWARAR
jgi:poly(3-hydroxyalkanoate) synthetase